MNSATGFAFALGVATLMFASSACSDSQPAAAPPTPLAEETQAVSANPILTSTPISDEPWTRLFGPGVARSVAVDSVDNVYAAGHAVVTAGPGQPWRRDVQVRKYDRVGALLWSQEFGSMLTTAIDEAASIATDRAGNVFVGGITLGALTGQTSAGGKDAFVRKFDRSGTEL
jgi:hypothetical protein